MKLKSKGLLAWVLGLIVIGAALGVTIYFAMNSYLKLEPVYKVKTPVEEHTLLEKGSFIKESMPAKNIPTDAIRTEAQLDEMVGKRARTMLVPGQVLQKANVSEASSIRELNQSISYDYVTLTIPLDTTDIPIDILHPNDVISLIGITKDPESSNQAVISEYVAENVLVLQALRDEQAASNKLIVLVPRSDSEKLEEIIVTGKVRVVLDPNKFEVQKPKVKEEVKVKNEQPVDSSEEK
ncbi:SAF domain-containing protein [Paenibacillus sp. 1A_MP2]|uniref:SAF domain-containing protein n=1 Tax=Paenibacillus sp. 1A_MP2 TaxID=3457495 RepID=UPI003FCE73E7